MKPKAQPKKAHPFAEIPAAYDIEEAKEQCRKRGLIPKIAIAWLQGVWVQVSIDEEYFAKQHSRRTRDEVLHEWLKELSPTFAEEVTDNDAPPTTIIQRRYACCVAISSGPSWQAWRDSDVCSYLISDKHIADELLSDESNWTNAPDEGTIFDTDDDSCALLRGWPCKGEIKASCVNFGRYLLRETARVYCLAVELIKDFEQTFNAIERPPDAEPPPDAILEWSESSRSAWLLHQCKMATMDMIHCIALLLDDEEPDAAKHMKWGFRIGKRLAQAEAIISSAGGTRFLVNVGVGRPSSKFWEWVHSDPRFAGKTAKEIWPLLDGCDDPDHSDKKLSIKDNFLVRVNGSNLKESSFTAKFKKH